MSILTHNSVFVQSLERCVIVATEESYAGQVVAAFCVEQRIMSDVWDYVHFAVVAQLDGELAEVDQVSYTFTKIRLGTSDDSCRATATVDASPELLQHYKDYLIALENRARDEQQKIEEANASRRARAYLEEQIRRAAVPKNGDTVTVRVDGRCRNPLIKAANGKTGKVFWTRDSKVGVALDNTRDWRGNYANVVWCNNGQVVKQA